MLQLKKIIPFIFLLVLITPAILHAQTTQQTREDLERQKRELQQELNEAQAALNETKKTSKQSLFQLNALRKKVALREGMIRNINGEINFINGDINSAIRDVKTLEKDLDTLKAQYAQLVVYAYKNRGAYAMLNFVFSANSFNDAIRRYEYMKQYREYRQRQADNIVQTQEQLKIKIANLEDQRGKRSLVLKTEQQEREVLEKDRKEKNDMVAALKGKEKELTADINKRKKDQQRIQASIRAIIAREMEEARKKAAAEELARKNAEAERKKREEAARKAALAAAAANNANNTATNNTPTPPPVKPDPTPAPPPVKSAARPERSLSVLENTGELVALSDRFEDNKGKLPWPVSSGTVIGEYGVNQDSEIKIKTQYDGILIATTKGASVKAIFDGEVISVFNAGPGYGWCVIIQHGRYFTNYVHIGNYAVKKGDKVKTGQNIGTVMTNVEENLGVLDVQVYKDGASMNPRTWLSPKR